VNAVWSRSMASLAGSRTYRVGAQAFAGDQL
jgi:hypothetical protein